MRLKPLLRVIGIVGLGSSFGLTTSNAMAQEGSSPSTPPPAAIPPVAASQEDKKPEEKKVDKPAKKPNTAVVEVAPFKIAAELDAIVDSPAKFEIALRPKSLKELKLVGVAGHGQRVARGQLILQLDGESLERSLRAAQQAVTSAESELKQASEANKTLDESLKLEMEAATLANDKAKDDLEYFLREGRAQQIDDLEYSIVSAKQSVDYAREEYEQLKKMYDADELTEESEEIVLKRAQNDLKRSERFLKSTERRVKRQLEVEIDRQQAALKNATAKSIMEFERLKLAQDSRRVAAKVGLAKAEAALESSQRELKQLNEDRQLLAIAAPFSGIVFWGTVNHQPWKGTAGSEDQLSVGNQLMPNRTLMTIVSNEKLFLHVNTPERLKNLVRPGLTAAFEATSNSDARTPVVCEDQIDIPLEPGSYRTAFRFERSNQAIELLPLMTGKLFANLYEKENALLIPIEAVRYDGSKSYVQLYNDQTSETKRQDVQVGKKDTKRIEITAGLREGEHVVLP